MAYPDLGSGRSELRLALAGRLRDVRLQLYGEEGMGRLCHWLGIPTRTWLRYEAGETIPADVILRFLAVTRVQAGWLLRGRGAQFGDGWFGRRCSEN
jgi:hypothetical protein